MASGFTPLTGSSGSSGSSWDMKSPAKESGPKPRRAAANLNSFEAPRYDLERLICPSENGLPADPPRRPTSWKPPPLPPAFFSPPQVPVELPKPVDPKLECFAEIFSFQKFEEAEIIRMIEDFIRKAPGDIKVMVLHFMHMSLECQVNTAPLFKALYIVTQHRTYGSIIRDCVIGEAERIYSTHGVKILLTPDGERRFRNLTAMFMAIAHHYRNLSKAPIREIVECLCDISRALAHFIYFDDVQIFVTLVFRVMYYASLPPANKEDTLPAVKQAHTKSNEEFFKWARTVARRTLGDPGDLPSTFKKWLMLLLEARNMPKFYECEDMVIAYKGLYGFEKLLPDQLIIKLPRDWNPNAYSISHISKYVKFGEDPEPSICEQVPAPVPAPAPVSVPARSSAPTRAIPFSVGDRLKIRKPNK